MTRTMTTDVLKKIFLSLIYPRHWLRRLFSILQRERERERERVCSALYRTKLLYCRSANTLEINFPLPREIISTISSYTHIGHHTIVALGLIIWRSSILRRMFSTIDSLPRQGQGDIFFSFSEETF